MRRYSYTFTKDYAGQSLVSTRYFNSPTLFNPKEDTDTEKIAKRIYRTHGTVRIESWKEITTKTI